MEPRVRLTPYSAESVITRIFRQLTVLLLFIVKIYFVVDNFTWQYQRPRQN